MGKTAETRRENYCSATRITTKLNHRRYTVRYQVPQRMWYGIILYKIYFNIIPLSSFTSSYYMYCSSYPCVLHARLILTISSDGHREAPRDTGLSVFLSIPSPYAQICTATSSVAAPCRQVGPYRRFGATSCLHLNSRNFLAPLSVPWRWRQFVLTKRPTKLYYSYLGWQNSP